MAALGKDRVDIGKGAGRGQGVEISGARGHGGGGLSNCSLLTYLHPLP